MQACRPTPRLQGVWNTPAHLQNPYAAAPPQHQPQESSSLLRAMAWGAMLKAMHSRWTRLHSADGAAPKDCSWTTHGQDPSAALQNSSLGTPGFVLLAP